MMKTRHPRVAAPSSLTARKAGLRYVLPDGPGITRHGKASSFAYRHPDGSSVRDKATLRRIRSLVIPPAWTDVWICPVPDGHIQATGRDVRRRKQYRYHPLWHEVRDEAKYDRLMAFGRALPQIRRRVSADLRRRDLSREKVMATIIRLLETTLIRVGNDEYAKQNGSYGLTTLRNTHAEVRGGQISFEFKGKSGKRHQIDVLDPRLAKLVRRCQEMPGQDLFGYQDADGTVHDVTSGDVNAYLREIAGSDFSAKDFRTWAGTILAAVALRRFAEFNSARQAKQNVVRAVESVAKMLGNTPAICRRCYVHPVVLESYLAGQTITMLKQSAGQRLRGALARLRPEEAAVMMLPRERLSQAGRAGGSKRAASLTRQFNGGRQRTSKRA